jgi:hypothetical protein
VAVSLTLKKQNQKVQKMNMRHIPAYVLSRANIEQFLHALARQFPQPSNLYLVSHAALVHLGLRSSTTNILHLTIETADEASMIAAIHRCAEALHLNVEFTSPKDALPIPWNWQDQSRYLGPYGYIDVFYFDFVSMALNGIVQGTRSDIHDVWLLVQQKIITLHDLDNAYIEVQPHMGRKPYDYIQPQQFAERYAQVRKWLVQNI